MTFGFHQDDKYKKISKLSVIILLTDIEIVMTILTNKTITYKGKGYTIVFWSNLYHKTAHVYANTMKLLICLKNNAKVTSKYNTIMHLVIRGNRKDKQIGIYVLEWRLTGILNDEDLIMTLSNRKLKLNGKFK